jgi:hypothetical protein
VATAQAKAETPQDLAEAAAAVTPQAAAALLACRVRVMLAVQAVALWPRVAAVVLVLLAVTLAVTKQAALVVSDYKTHIAQVATFIMQAVAVATVLLQQAQELAQRVAVVQVQ